MLRSGGTSFAYCKDVALRTSLAEVLAGRTSSPRERRLSMRRLSVSLLLPLLLALSPAAARAAVSDDCLACHSDSSLRTERKGRTLSLYVDRTVLQRSPHDGMDCTDCHAGLDPTAMPHAARIRLVDCKSCHDGVAGKHGFHAALSSPGAKLVASDCKDCHGTHAVEAPSRLELRDGKPHPGGACASCHEDVVAEYQRSDHGLAAAAGAKGAPRCVTCHRHAITSA